MSTESNNIIWGLQETREDTVEEWDIGFQEKSSVLALLVLHWPIFDKLFIQFALNSKYLVFIFKWSSFREKALSFPHHVNKTSKMCQEDRVDLWETFLLQELHHVESDQKTKILMSCGLL